MEKPWVSKLWRQTATNARAEGLSPTKNFEAIAAQTAKLIEEPYNASLWAARAMLLAGVRYPDLAAGDARKAQKLGTAMLSRKGLGSEARKQFIGHHISPVPADIIMQDQRFWDVSIKEFHYKNFMTLAAALNQADAYHSYREMCLEARAMYPADNIFSQGLASANEALKDYKSRLERSRLPQLKVEEYLKFGMVLSRKYPFMQPGYIHRSAQLIAKSNAWLHAMGAPCVVAVSHLGSSAPSPPSKLLHVWNSLKQFFGLETESDTLGVFATSNIKKGAIIFKDPTIWGANTVPPIVHLMQRGRIQQSMFRCDNCCGVQPVWQKKVYRSECCNTTYCSTECLESAKATYHRVLCGKDFSWLEKKLQPAGVKPVPAVGSDVDGKMWLRILATCVQSGLHPLEHPSMASLTPNYECEVPRRWSLATHIDVPQKILTTLGIDIFTDHRYDTWVLQTIWARMMNNGRGGVGSSGVASRSINPLYSFINHSCEPNAVALNASVGSSTVVVVANRNIEKGEELGISYLSDMDQDRRQRNLKLRNWLAGDCMCSRCRREMESGNSV